MGGLLRRRYFGSKLGGMWFTTAGWVQSYGSRYVRPPLIVSDIQYGEAMAVWEYQVCASSAGGGRGWTARLGARLCGSAPGVADKG